MSLIMIVLILEGLGLLLCFYDFETLKFDMQRAFIPTWIVVLIGVLLAIPFIPYHLIAAIKGLRDGVHFRKHGYVVKKIK